MPYLSGVTAISAGFFHNLALVNNSPGGGTVCSWGRNSAGELGIGPSSPGQLLREHRVQRRADRGLGRRRPRPARRRHGDRGRRRRGRAQPRRRRPALRLQRPGRGVGRQQQRAARNRQHQPVEHPGARLRAGPDHRRPRGVQRLPHGRHEGPRRCGQHLQPGAAELASGAFPRAGLRPRPRPASTVEQRRGAPRRSPRAWAGSRGCGRRPGGRPRRARRCSSAVPSRSQPSAQSPSAATRRGSGIAS